MSRTDEDDNTAALAADHHRRRSAVIGPGHTYASVTDQISAIVLTRKTPRGWVLMFGVASLLLTIFMVSVFEIPQTPMPVMISL